MRKRVYMQRGGEAEERRQKERGKDREKNEERERQRKKKEEYMSMRKREPISSYDMLWSCYMRYIMSYYTYMLLAIIEQELRYYYYDAPYYYFIPSAISACDATYVQLHYALHTWYYDILYYYYATVRTPIDTWCHVRSDIAT